MDPGAPQAIPLHIEGDIAVGLNKGRPDGAHRLKTIVHLCALEIHSMVGQAENVDQF